MRKLIQSWRKRWIPFVMKSTISGYDQIEGFLSNREASALAYIAQNLDEGSTIVEIGAWKGKSTYCMGKSKKPNTRICSIDPFNADITGEEDQQILKDKKGEKDLLDQYKDNLAKLGSKNSEIYPYKGYSQEFPDKFERIDFLFIDGDHSYEGVKSDFDNYANKIPVGGWIAFHDYRPWRKDYGPTMLINSQVLKGGQFKRFCLFDSLWVGQKVSN